MWQAFKAFIAQGNVIDLAVGIIIGAAFGNIVSSLVDHVLMPSIGLLLGGIDFTSLAVNVGEVKIEYGIFIQSVVDFLIIAFSVFIIIRFISKMRKKKAEEEIVEEVDEQTELLREIRDLLKQ